MIELLLQAERALAMGLVDQAERLYRQAVDADPRNSIAVVGLARVALERGDDAEAWRQARQALGIDRENAAAARLVERLEEVWRHRGQPLPPERAPDAVSATTPPPAAGGDAGTPSVERGAAPAVTASEVSSSAAYPQQAKDEAVVREPTPAERHAAELLAALGLGNEPPGSAVEASASLPEDAVPTGDTYGWLAAPASDATAAPEFADRDVPAALPADATPADEPPADEAPVAPAAWPPPDRGVAPIVPRLAFVDRLLGRKRE